MPRQIRITMNANTVNALFHGGYQLYAMRAVQTSNRAGRPTVWSAIKGYSLQTTVGWLDGYAAYTSCSAIRVGATVSIGASYPIVSGQVLKVGPAGLGIVADGPADLMSAWNTTNTQLSSGLSQIPTNAPVVTDQIGGPVGAEFSPFFVAPLYGQQLDGVRVTSTLLLIFSTELLAPGTVIERFPVSRSDTGKLESGLAVSQSLLIDASEDRNLSYDINASWSWGGEAWAKTLPPDIDLVPIMVLREQ